MILLVEDDEDVRDMLAFAFRSSGMSTTLVKNGTEALAALERETPCLVVLDLVMPGVTGWQVMEQMKARGLTVPVCVISAGGESPPEAVASFCKPFDVRELVKLAARYCAHAV